MKRFLLAAGLLALVGFSARAQGAVSFTFADLPLDATTHLVTYADVVPVAGATKEQLCFRAKEWAARYFMANARAPQLLDQAAGTYSCRGVVHLPYGTSYSMVLTIYAQDGSYKYVINQLFYSYSASSSDALSGTREESAEHWATYKKRNLHYVDVRVQEVHQLLPPLLASLHSSLIRPLPKAAW